MIYLLIDNSYNFIVTIKIYKLLNEKITIFMRRISSKVVISIQNWVNSFKHKLKKFIMDRKTFLKKTAGALLISIPAYGVISCSTSDDGNNNPNPPNNNTGNCLQNGATASSISGNHGHSLIVSKADVEAGVEKTYSIQGSANHPHQITVTAAQFNTLKSNNQIFLNSTVNSDHTHTVTISCAS